MSDIFFSQLDGCDSEKIRDAVGRVSGGNPITDHGVGNTGDLIINSIVDYLRKCK
jgi:hypothetical protein